MRLACVTLLVGIHGAEGHYQYLAYCPNLYAPYFDQWGVGAVGHMNGISGAKLNSFGKAFKKIKSCPAVGAEDDDDDDDDHHYTKVWATKFCCEDSDGDGQYNGWELGDPCCTWRRAHRPPAAHHSPPSAPSLATCCRFHIVALPAVHRPGTPTCVAVMCNPTLLMFTFRECAQVWGQQSTVPWLQRQPSGKGGRDDGRAPVQVLGQPLHASSTPRSNAG